MLRCNYIEYPKKSSSTPYHYQKNMLYLDLCLHQHLGITTNDVKRAILPSHSKSDTGIQTVITSIVAGARHQHLLLDTSSRQLSRSQDSRLSHPNNVVKEFSYIKADELKHQENSIAKV